MKKLISILFLISFSISLAAGGEEFVCGMSSTTFYRGPQQGGLYKTSYGTLNALVIFVQFSDDTAPSDGWSITNPPSLPAWAGTYINGLHDYFYEMSNGIFNLTGIVYQSVYVPNTTQSEYANIGEVNHEALTALDDQINYALFDNWTGTDEGADGDVDLIFMVYRNFEDRLTTSPWGSD